jgi:phage terminase large subunit
MEALKARDYNAYKTVWEGECRKVLDGAIFGQELEAAEKTGRISVAPYDKGYPVTVSWDLGYSDFTSLWFMQKIGEKINIIDCYQNHLVDISHFVTILQERGYVYDTDLLPHDAGKTELGTGKSILERLNTLGRHTRVVPLLSKKEQIDEGRRFMAKCTFDAEKCREGLSALRRYRYAFNEQQNTYTRDPVHDVSSHYSDSFLYLAIGQSENNGALYKHSDRLKKQIQRSKHSAVLY